MRRTSYQRRAAARRAYRNRRARRTTICFLIGAFVALAALGYVMSWLGSQSEKKKDQPGMNIKILTPSPRPSKEPTPTPFYYYYDRDNTDAVMELQNRLKELNYYDGEITGKYDELTAQAVRDYQVANMFPETGIADDTTLARMFGVGSVPNITVYVSKNGLWHTTRSCSGMKEYTPMSIVEAMREGYQRHNKCN